MAVAWRRKKSSARGTLALAVKLVNTAKAELRGRGWRIFDGDVDLVTTGGAYKGAVDALADLGGDANALLALVEVKARHSVGNTEVHAARICNDLDQFWAKCQSSRLKTAWTHGMLVVLWQCSASRYFVDRDQCRAVVWRRGAPPIAPQPKARPQPKAKVAPQPKAKAAPQLVLHSMTLTEKFNVILKHLKKKGAVLDGDVVLLKDFLKVFRLANTSIP